MDKGLIDQQSEQYRRGQVLGFTMAEMMLILLFLLLLLLGSKINDLANKLNNSFTPNTPQHQSVIKLEETLIKLQEDGIVNKSKDIAWLTERLVLASEEVLTNEAISTTYIDDLLKENRVLEQELMNTKLELETARQFIELNNEVKEEVQTALELAPYIKDNGLTLDEGMQCLASCGGGPKACWGESLKNPDYIYNIALYDDYVFITSNPENIRNNMADWVTIDSSARIAEPTMLTNTDFRNRFSKLLLHAKANECVYQARLVDVSTSSKQTYKKQRRLVEGYVYTTPLNIWSYGNLPN